METIKGVCPKCGTDNYSREDIEMNDDVIIYICVCDKCGAEFEETFVLVANKIIE